MNTQNIAWLKSGNKYQQISENANITNALPKSVYRIHEDFKSGELFLEPFMDKFSFNFKVYGIEDTFIDYVMKTFHNTSSNLGIIFNGIKGTGKTVTAKIIANKMDLPVIIVDRFYRNLTSFLSRFNTDCILFFDEFEKSFNVNKDEDTALLSLMDGMYNSSSRKIFLLTTNTLSIDQNFLGRPSRIRYKKTFSNLPIKVVKEYLKDNLKYSKFTDDIIDYVDTLQISTIDILKTIIEDINIHQSMESIKLFFNTEPAYFDYSYCRSKNDITNQYSKEQFKRDCNNNSLPSDTCYTRQSIKTLKKGDRFMKYIITEPLDEDNIVVTIDEYGTRLYFKILNPDTSPSIYNR